jgi:hypothetical protein
VYEIYKAGEDPYWVDGLDLMSRLGLCVSIVPHFDDSSGGDNYDSRFCYMGAERFDLLQQRLPPDVTILGIDAYTGICFDPNTGKASISGQGGVTVISGDGAERHVAGAELPFSAFHSSSRELVTTYEASTTVSGYEFTDEAGDGNAVDGLERYIEGLGSLTGNEKIDLLARLRAISENAAAEGTSPETEQRLVDLVVELRDALRAARRYDLADKARDLLDDVGIVVNDTPAGAKWSRR